MRLLDEMRTQKMVELMQQQQLMVNIDGTRQSLTQALLEDMVKQGALNGQTYESEVHAGREGSASMVSKFRAPEDLVMGKVDDAARGLHARLGLPSRDLYERLALGVHAITEEYRVAGTAEELEVSRPALIPAH